MTKVLVADDLYENRYLLISLLQGHGYEVVPATNGAEALSLAQSCPPDLIITDVLMPVMDGFELCRRWQQDEHLKGIPFVVYTATYTDPKDESLALRLGADLFLIKPQKPEVLLQAVREILGKPGRDPDAERSGPPASEAELLHRHNEALMRKLKRKVSQLEEEITHSAEVESALRQSERRFRLLTESALDVVWSTGFDGRFTYVSPSVKRLRGYTPEEVMNQSPEEVFMPEGLRHFNEMMGPILADLAAGRDPDHNDIFELEQPCKGGSTVWTEVSAGIIRDENRKAIGIQGVSRDITARKRAERELQRSEENYHTLFNNAGDAIFIREASGTFIDANDVACERLGYSRAELLAMTSRDLDDPTNSMDVDRRTEIIQRDGSALFETVHIARDGRRIPTEINARLIRYQGKEAILSINRDITERQRLEDQFRMSQKMEAIGSLAGGVAHDFNNLLSVILSYTGFVLNGMREGDPQRDDLLEVKEAADRAVTLTRQLLAFSRKQVLQPVPLDLNQIAAAIEKMLRRILGEDIDYRQRLAADLGLTLADPGQIEQVIMNLVVNARDAMPEGGKLTIETSNMEIDEEFAAQNVAVKPGSYVQLAVTDTGCGMDEQARGRIFEPFFTTKEKGKGTGLGLSTVYGIVKQSGGDILVYSELGRGTTFKVYLPRDLSATRATAIKPSTVPRLSTGTETVLMVEDEEALRKVALRSLSAAGYKVLTAADGDEALLQSAQHEGDIHLLLTDVVMPRMSGRVLAQELSKNRPTVKVLYLSGYTDDAIVHHGVLDAGTQFLAKPFTAADLAQKVREVLDGGITNAADGHEPAAKDDAEVEKKKPLDKSALRALPVDVLTKLRKAVIAARYNEIIKIIETIRTTKPNLATELLRMADLFDYDGMRHFLNSGKKDDNGR